MKAFHHDLPCLRFILVVEVIGEFGSGGDEYGNWVHSDSFVEILSFLPGNFPSTNPKAKRMPKRRK